MENSDESSSENNIEVLGIKVFPESPHQINKKACFLKLLFEKGSPNQYQSRLGFNLYKLPVGYYTMVVEWFPPEMNEVSVTPQATTISISNHTTKTFEKYTKTVIHFHRWGSSPPQYIYLDLYGTVRNPSLIKIGHLIVYGVKETISTDPEITVSQNYKEKLEKMPAILGCWKFRRLSLLGKVMVLKSLEVSQLVYILSPFPTYYEAIQEINSLFYKFLWSDKVDKIKRNVMINDYPKGGIKMIDIISFNKSLEAVWVKKYLDNENCGHWKLFFDAEVKKYGGKAIFRGNLNKTDTSNLIRVSDPFC